MAEMDASMDEDSKYGSQRPGWHCRWVWMNDMTLLPQNDAPYRELQTVCDCKLWSFLSLHVRVCVQALSSKLRSSQIFTGDLQLCEDMAQ